LRRCSIIKLREDWYGGPKATDRHWPALEGYLRNTKGWGGDAVDSMDETSTEVVSLLANPAGDQFRCRGLVVGYVQSGKTANMTAVIAKAVDAGYNLIVLLGGMTNKLRAQTQRRIEADIVERHRHLWQLYTTGEDHGDFTVPANGSFTMPVEGRAQLVVMKKITSRLNAFHRTVRKTPPAILKSLKVLLIDDECDQASVNSAKDDYDITKINDAIRSIIRSLPAVSYVGYTATPFANVFIDPFPHNKEELDDLYPEDFITSLPRPKGYFGTREVFGTDPVDADEETPTEAGRDMIRVVPEDELGLLRPERAADKDIFQPDIAPSLENALLWFFASCAIRRKRAQSGAHMTMLIHTSPNVAQHRKMAETVRSWLDANSSDLRSGRGDAFRRMTALLEEEVDRVPPPASGDMSAPGGASDLMDELGEVLDALEIAIENGESEERLDYTGDPKTYIVVGGAVLARGLTLEGLCVSFFLRTAKQYDTLLQMGRWFGYRHGYEDLPRLWTTADLADSFRALAHIEEEIRDDIEIYRDRKVSPLDFAVRVRAIPGMA
ncbi:MAG: Z1 domain-containing protein, partial [Oricola sp.]|nr:Z1 domain-containing protein [Oricola sp.]